MAQNFVGSNNINLLQPNGQFGSRIMGGSDSASPRYIHTELNPLVDYIYPKNDFPLLTYNNDDGMIVEPEYYVPIIPMVLINGMIGIGTGFSSNITQYNPLDIIKCIKNKLNDELDWLNDSDDDTSIFSHGTDRSTTRYGTNLSGFGEIFAQNMTNGLMIGVGTAYKPIIFSSNGREVLRIQGGPPDGPEIISGSAVSTGSFGTVQASHFTGDGAGLTNVPDYVFEPEYVLRSLSDVEEFVSESKHLPGIPGMDDMSEWKQYSVGDRDMLLLEKIEELTLYVIRLEKRIKDLENN